MEGVEVRASQDEGGREEGVTPPRALVTRAILRIASISQADNPQAPIRAP